MPAFAVNTLLDAGSIYSDIGPVIVKLESAIQPSRALIVLPTTTLVL